MAVTLMLIASCAASDKKAIIDKDFCGDLVSNPPRRRIPGQEWASAWRCARQERDRAEGA
jgi:hypothetical protein